MPARWFQRFRKILPVFYWFPTGFVLCNLFYVPQVITGRSMQVRSPYTFTSIVFDLTVPMFPNQS